MQQHGYSLETTYILNEGNHSQKTTCAIPEQADLWKRRLVVIQSWDGWKETGSDGLSGWGFFLDDENVLKLYHGDGCITLNILKTTELYH